MGIYLPSYPRAVASQMGYNIHFVKGPLLSPGFVSQLWDQHPVVFLRDRHPSIGPGLLYGLPQHLWDQYTKYVKVSLEKSSDGNAFIDDAIKNGNITEVKVYTHEKLIETTIVLK